MAIPKKENIRQQALKFLQQHKTATISTVAPDGSPNGAIVTCIFDDDFNIYFATRRDSRKLQNILRDPRVAITVGGDPKAPSTMQMEGRAEVIEAPRHFRVSYLSQKINIADAHWQPLLKAHEVDFIFLKVIVDWARWLNLDAVGSPRVYNENFQEIISRDTHQKQ